MKTFRENPISAQKSLKYLIIHLDKFKEPLKKVYKQYQQGDLRFADEKDLEIVYNLITYLQRYF